MKRYKYSAFCLILCPLISFAGLNKLTAHSRANCINNESSWDATESHMLLTVSEHWKFKVDEAKKDNDK